MLLAIIWLTLLTEHTVFSFDYLDYFPVLNHCCGQGEDYHAETDSCVSNSFKDNSSDPKLQNGTETAKEHIISVPSSLIVHSQPTVQTNSTFTFRLRTLLPATCYDGHFIETISLKENDGNNTNGGNLTGDAVQRSGVKLYSPEGQVRIEDDYFSPAEYCIFGITNDVLKLRVCNATCTGLTPCVRKCCDLDEIWNVNYNTSKRQACMAAGEGKFWSPALYDSYKAKLNPETRAHIQIHYKIVHPRKFCRPPNETLFFTYIEHRDNAGHYHWKWRLGQDGRIYRRKSRYTWIERNDNPPDTFCIDGLVNSRFAPESQTEHSGRQEDELLVQCLRPFVIESSETKDMVYIVSMSISCIFIVLTIAVHVVLWEKQPNHVWNMTLISYSASLFCYYVILIGMRVSNAMFRQGHGVAFQPVCYTIGVCVHFFMLSTFAWMSAINFDIFCTFRRLKPTLGKVQGLKRYYYYAGFCVSLPIVIVAIALVLEHFYDQDFDSPVIVPEYGKKYCNLDPEYAQLVYSYGPAGVLLVFNIVCFILTNVMMHRIQKSTKLATSSSTKNNTQKQAHIENFTPNIGAQIILFATVGLLGGMKLFGKLLIVMGVPWIIDIVSEYTEREKLSGNAWYWVILDMITIFQSIAIFWVFVCKRDILQLLAQKYPWFKRILSRITTDEAPANTFNEKHPRLSKFVRPMSFNRAESDESKSSAGTPSAPSTISSSVSNEPECNTINLAPLEIQDEPDTAGEST